MSQAQNSSLQLPVTTVPPWQEAPSWYVTNGQAVVGPVNTKQLLRGLDEGRVARDCYIAQHSWSNWRRQNHVREIRALRRWQWSKRVTPEIEPVKRALRAPRFDPNLLERETNVRKLLAKTLELAVRATRANVGVVHRPRAPHVGLVTSFTHGPGMGLNLGEVVPWHDDARAVATRNRAILGQPDRDPWARSSARRLSCRIQQRVSGVAVVPIRFGPSRGLLELGRYDHGFRDSDVAVLEDLESSVVDRLSQLTD